MRWFHRTPPHSQPFQVGDTFRSASPFTFTAITITGPCICKLLNLPFYEATEDTSPHWHIEAVPSGAHGPIAYFNGYWSDGTKVHNGRGHILMPAAAYQPIGQLELIKGGAMAGKTSCKYYVACGSTENCKKCKGYVKKEGA